jgi:hypothetical protein
MWCYPLPKECKIFHRKIMPGLYILKGYKQAYSHYYYDLFMGEAGVNT